MTTETRRHCDDIEVDKIPGAWVLTWWLDDYSATLRLKIRHRFWDEPDDFVAEVKLSPDEEFQSIREFSLRFCEINHPEAFDNVWDDLPDIWTEEFKALAQMWARFISIAEFGPNFEERYAGEPTSSLDHFYCETYGRNG
jgi:hypothetical protein